MTMLYLAAILTVLGLALTIVAAVWTVYMAFTLHSMVGCGILGFLLISVGVLILSAEDPECDD